MVSVKGLHTLTYTAESEIRRIAHSAFLKQRVNVVSAVCSIDKSNVLEVTVLWKEIMEEVAKEYPDVELSHMLVDNAAMQLVKCTKTV